MLVSLATANSTGNRPPTSVLRRYVPRGSPFGIVTEVSTVATNSSPRLISTRFSPWMLAINGPPPRSMGNPLGVTMPDSDRERLVRLLEQYDVALVEDDVYGDLRFDGQRPVPTQFLGSKARILTCGSFSKTAASGYRIGWVVTSQYIDEIARLKRSFSCSSGLLQQLTLANFLASGDYSRHLKTLVPVLKRNSERMRALVAEHFPSETRTSRPVGGSVLWLELPQNVDAEQLFDDAIDAGISIAPGHIFSPCACYTNFIRLSFGHPWNEKTENAIAWLGKHVSKLASQ